MALTSPGQSGIRVPVLQFQEERNTPFSGPYKSIDDKSIDRAAEPTKASRGSAEWSVAMTSGQVLLSFDISKSNRDSGARSVKDVMIALAYRCPWLARLLSHSPPLIKDIVTQTRPTFDCWCLGTLTM